MNLHSIAVWSSWSSWSPCNILCGEGVRQRSRNCFGLGDCDNPDFRLQMEPCNSSCCDAKGWGSWLPWSACPCGTVGGVRKTTRVCSSPQCPLSCTGPSKREEECPPRTCPVHGGWSSWSSWSQCSGSCIDDQHSDVTPPSKVRYHSCTNPAPSNDTDPPGNHCPGDYFQKEDCSDLPNCPVDGNWGEWSPAGPCSTSCGEGLMLSIRICNSPAPKHGGRLCEGSNTQTSICRSPCPVDGFWTGWSSWSDCPSSCISNNQAPPRSRRRSCSNPAPSSVPPGKPCQGETHQTGKCNHLPHCPVDGGWGSWSPYTPCSVTCGVGLRVSVRKCDSPASEHGGLQCPGEGRRTIICTTNVHCPVDGVWSPWSSWTPCKSLYGNKNITCRMSGGSQTRLRHCLHRGHNGSICEGSERTHSRVCYDVHNCDLKGTWDGWKLWSSCEPLCGGMSSRSRVRHCKPDYSGYRPIGLKKLKPEFSGTPHVACGPTPDGGEASETQRCHNTPPCSHESDSSNRITVT
ncbi:properdin [Seriola lalandi dorsalis]|uniref:properdin n=1 Tax=Seriola lalandi dorsalis TaxID=1841481 RepID=UPI000C6F5723|nr:properdin [Seriola lalandi dorsalis]